MNEKNQGGRGIKKYFQKVFREAIMYHKPICMKSLLLGLGAGIIITGILSLIYTMGINTEPSQEDLIAYAKKNNMILQKNGSEKALSPDADERKDQMTQKQIENVATKPEVESSKDSIEMKEFVISSGHTSEKVAKHLKDMNIIQNEEEFLKYLQRNRLEERLQVGKYSLHKAMNYEEIARIVTRRQR